jgi:hypothetical protein
MSQEPRLRIFEIKHWWSGIVLHATEAANLREAVIHASLDGASLVGASLVGASLNWSSHTLIAEILLRAAEEDIEKRKIAGLIAISRDWCWDEFLLLKNDPLFDWALDTLAPLVREGDKAPSILLRRSITLANKPTQTGETVQ